MGAQSPYLDKMLGADFAQFGRLGLVMPILICANLRMKISCSTSGGQMHQVDALTFGDAFVSLAEAIRAINHDLNPGYGLEIQIEAVGPGSFRARLKTTKKSLRNLFSAASVRDVVVALFATFLWGKVISPDQPPKIIVDGEVVVIEHGEDRIIVLKEVFDQEGKGRKKLVSKPARCAVHGGAGE